jgi:hypothetical protein
MMTATRATRHAAHAMVKTWVPNLRAGLPDDASRRLDCIATQHRPPPNQDEDGRTKQVKPGDDTKIAVTK